MSLERVTRVSEALYRVTDLMPDEEPLKWTLRAKAIQLVELMSAVSSSTSLKGRADISIQITQLIDALTRLLDIAAGASFISRVNFDVLQREYGLLRDLPNAQEFVLFPISTAAPAPTVEKEKSVVASSAEAVSPAMMTTQRAPQVAGVSPSKKVANEVRPREVQGARTTPQKDSERSTRILSYLGAHPWASRGDVAAIFGREISEKTLQRELAHLVDTGVIRKEGEKRWCRYSLKGQK
jgi:hypothetical protein